MADRIGIEYRLDLNKLKADYKKAQGIASQFHNWIETASRTVSKTQSDTRGIKSATTDLKKMGITAQTSSKDVLKIADSLLKLKRVGELTKRQMDKVAASTDLTGKEAKKASTRYALLSERFTVVNNKIKQMEGRFGDAQRAQERWSISGIKNIILSQSAWIASGAIIFGTLATITQGLKDIATYHQSFKMLKAITDANAESMEIMGNSIREASVSTKFFASDMTKAAIVLGQAGFSAEEVSNTVGALAVLASATGRELNETADLMTTIIRAFDMSASESLRVANVLAAGISKSKLQINDLITAFNYMGVASHQFGISLESAVSWLGVLRDRGLKASTIGTSFRGVLATLVKETDKFSRVLSKLDTPLAFSDITIRNGRRLEDSLDRLSKAGFSVSEAFIALPRRTAMTFSLMVKNVDAFKKLREEITGTNKAVEMNEIAMKGINSQLLQTKSILDEFFLAATDAGGAFEPIISTLKFLVQLTSITILTISELVETVVSGLTAIVATPVAMIISLIEKIPRSLDDIKKFFLNLGKEETEKALVPDKEVLSRGKAVWEAFLEERKKSMEKTALAIERLSRGMFGTKEPFLSKGEEEEKVARETFATLTKTLELEKKVREELRKAGKEGTEEWRKQQEKIVLLNNQILELKETLKLPADEIMGPILSVQDRLIDMAVTSKTSLEDLYKVFKKGDQDINNVTKVLNNMKKEGVTAFSEWKDVLSRDTDQWKKLVGIIKEVIKGEKVLGTLRKKESKEIEKNIKTKEALEKRYATLKRSIQEKIINADLKGFEKNRIKTQEEFYTKKTNLKELFSETARYYDKIGSLVTKHPALKSELENTRKLIESIRKSFYSLGTQFEESIESQSAKERTKIEEKILQKKTEISDRIAKLNETDKERRIRAINETFNAEQKVLDKLILAAETQIESLKKVRDERGRIPPEIQKEIDALDKLIAKINETKEESKKAATATIEAGKDAVAGFKKGIEDIIDDWGNEFKNAENLARDSATAMKNTFSDIFFDSMTGQMKKLSEYWKSFKNMILRSLAEIAAREVALQVLRGIKSVFLAGATAGAASAGVSTAATSAGQISGGSLALVHQGGLIGNNTVKRMHDGGIASNELLTILKKNEFVLNDSAASKIGRANLEFMNKTGQIPQQQRPIQKVVNNYYIDAMDPASFEERLKTTGAMAISQISLGTIERERRTNTKFR